MNVSELDSIIDWQCAWLRVNDGNECVLNNKYL